MLPSMARSLRMAMATPQQPTTPATMDMSWMAHTPDNANMTVLGMERLQNAVKYRVSDFCKNPQL